MQVDFKKGDVGLLTRIMDVHEKAIVAAIKALEAIGVATTPVDVESSRLSAASKAIVAERVKRTKALADWHEDMPIVEEIEGEVMLKAELCGTLISACELYVAKVEGVQTGEMKLGIDTGGSQDRIAAARDLLYRLRGQGSLKLEKIG